MGIRIDSAKASRKQIFSGVFSGGGGETGKKITDYILAGPQ